MRHRSRHMVRIWAVIGIAVIGLLMLAGVTLLLPQKDEIKTYIIVGGGASGCIMAERLSSVPSNRVLLVEAGPRADTDTLIQNITNAPTLEANYYSKYFWQYAQEAAEVIPNRLTLQLTTGRLLGGGSSVNGMQFVRGTDYIYDQWAALTDLPIWSSANILNSFKDMETFSGVSGTPGKHGDAGRLSVLELHTTAPQNTTTSMAEKLVTAYEQLTGLPRLPDYNDLTAGARVGPFERWHLHANADGTRDSTSTAFLSPDVMARPNLDVQLESTVTRILFNANKRATGIVYIHNGREVTVAASRRVILCAGVYSPTLLQHSGIGDAAHLASIGVPLVYHNPNVGRRMHNHQVATAVFSKNASDTTSANPADIYEGGAFLPSPNPIDPMFANETASPRRVQVIGINAPGAMVLALIDLQPQSPGFVRIRSADPLRVAESSDRILVPPDGDIDAETLKNIYREYVAKLHHEFQGTGVGPAIDPSYTLLSPSLATIANDTLLTEFVRTAVASHAHHWTGTTRMGKVGDGISVTDGRGSVWGVTGLTVADASVMPYNSDGNTVAPTAAIAWTVAKEILAGNV